MNISGFLNRCKVLNSKAMGQCSVPMVGQTACRFTEQQCILMLHRARDLLVGQRTALINALRAHFAELGIVVAQGPQHVGALAQRPEGGLQDGVELHAPRGHELQKNRSRRRAAKT